MSGPPKTDDTVLMHGFVMNVGMPTKKWSKPAKSEVIRKRESNRKARFDAENAKPF